MVHMRQIRSRPRPLAAIVAGAAVVGLLVTAGCSASPRNGGSPFHSDQRPNPYRTNGPGPVDPNREPRSTFAVDIDTASYGFARRQILDGSRPDPQTVRPEEFLNAF